MPVFLLADVAGMWTILISKSEKKIRKTAAGLPITPMRRCVQKFGTDKSGVSSAVVCCLSVLFTLIIVTAGFVQVSLAQTGVDPQTIDPQTRAKEISALAPASEKKDLRKEEVKDLSVVMRGVETTLRTNIEGLLDIWQFHGKRIPSVSRMRFMHRQATEQIQSALRPYGYYRATVDARLSDLGNKWQAVYKIVPGDRVKVNKTSIKVTGSGKDDPEFKQLADFAAANIRKGIALDQQLYEAIKQNILNSAANLGYFDSEFMINEILVDLESYTADVTLHFNTGERYRLGELLVTEDVDWLSEELLAKYIELEELEYFDAGKIQKVQSDLGNTSYYDSVLVRASADDAVEKVIPVNVDLEHQNPKQFVYGVGYGTDTGARVSFGLTRRRVNRSGHHYLVQTRLSEIGYEVGGTYTIPTGDPRTDSYGLTLNIEEEDSDSRDFRNVEIGGNYRYLDGLWFKTYALNYQLEENRLDGDDSSLLIPSIEWVRTSPFELEKRLNVYRGDSLKLELRGASDAILSDTNFIQAQVTAKKIISFESGKRFIFRGSLGATAVEDFLNFPLSLRFYTGGDTTVRGFDFDTIGTQDDEDNVLGGKNLVEFSAEYEVPFNRPNFSWAVFGDVGDAFNESVKLRNSFGIGLRWRSPFGPIRLDLARGLDNPNNGGYRLHFGLGPDL